MKKIIFIRHGRAEDPTPEISDFERSLSTKGKVISKFMANKFKEKENNDFLIISSPAFRALETAIIFAEVLGIEPDKIILNSNLYYKMTIHYIHEILSIINEDIDSIALFGHNPSFTEIADRLSHQGSEFIPKCGIVCISFNVRTWQEVIPNKGNVDYFLKPGKAE